jgi:hypothetical protein
MSVWFAIPSARPAKETQLVVNAWRQMGYKVALWRNGEARNEHIECDHKKVTPDYRGWGPSINILIRELLLVDPAAEWFVGGGDDTYPDLTTRANVIAEQCAAHFHRGLDQSTFGVMQPIGDLQAWPGSRIDKFAGSPWIGKDFALRALGGRGPFHSELHHMFGDEFLQIYAQRLGCFWQRADLTHRHEHWMRETGRPEPDHLKVVNSRGHWNESRMIFERLVKELNEGKIL